MTGAGGGPPRFDWGLGRYEHTAAQLAPASEVVVERAAPRASERVLDLGCGTGNAALLAAARGATVTGVDPARLLAPHGFSVQLEPHAHTFTAASIDDFLRAEFIDHPLGVASRAMLEARGRTDVQAEIIVRAREMLAAANEEADGFAVTRPYVVAVARRPQDRAPRA